VTVLETLASYSEYTKDVGLLTEYVRAALSRQICKDYVDATGTMTVITVDPDIEGLIRSSIHDDPVEGRVVGLDPDTHVAVMKSLLDAYGESKKKGFVPVFLVSPQIRSVTFSLLQREIPDPAVLAYNEIVPNIKVNVVTSAAMENAA
jgi:flagellar biosynthesis protein FlhA